MLLSTPLLFLPACRKRYVCVPCSPKRSVPVQKKAECCTLYTTLYTTHTVYTCSTSMHTPQRMCTFCAFSMHITQRMCTHCHHLTASTHLCVIYVSYYQEHSTTYVHSLHVYTLHTHDAAPAPDPQSMSIALLLTCSVSMPHALMNTAQRMCAHSMYTLCIHMTQRLRQRQIRNPCPRRCC